MSYKISLKEAGIYLSNLLRESSLSTIPRNVAIGGTYAVPTLPSTSGEGLMFWYNFVGVSPGVHDFFLTCQEYPNPGNRVTHRLPIGNDELLKPSETFTYNKISASPAECENYIENHNTGNTPTSRLIPKATVQSNVISFLRHFPKDPNGFPYNDRAHSFVSAEAGSGDFNELISQPSVGGVRYYFGLDSDVNAINRLRIIFVAVDHGGANIINKTNPVILQRLVP